MNINIIQGICAPHEKKKKTTTDKTAIRYGATLTWSKASKYDAFTTQTDDDDDDEQCI